MRTNDWPEKLAAFIDSRRETPFAWGGHDCYLFAADAVLAMTGIDYAGQREKYDSALAAARILEEFGGLGAVLRADYGASISPNFAQRGDVCLVQAERGDAAAICLGAEVVAPGELGLVFYPASEVVNAWHVG